jgi:hypothetical protein
LHEARAVRPQAVGCKEMFTFTPLD